MPGNFSSGNKRPDTMPNSSIERNSILTVTGLLRAKRASDAPIPAIFVMLCVLFEEGVLILRLLLEATCYCLAVHRL